MQQDWIEQEEMAENMIPLLGRLYRKHNVVVDLCGKPMVNQNIIDIIKIHKFAKKYMQENFSIKDTLGVLTELSKMDLGAARIDLGKMTAKFLKQEVLTCSEFLKLELKDVLGDNKCDLVEKAQDIVLFGFGRIGRLLARILVEKTGGGNKMLLRAIVVRPTNIKDDLEKRASLLRRDSVHGPFKGTISHDYKRQILSVNGNEIQIIYSDTPDGIDYTKYGISDAILIDNTGAYRDKKGLGLHLKSKGISQVVLTAPGKDIPNIVAGVNYESLKKEDKIVSCASCTTNAIVPILALMDKKYEIEYAHVETVHSYTNDQNLLDNFHAKSRRGRSAPLNMVITETGAAEAVKAVIPHLEGKVTGNSIRVPTANVSLAILNMNVKNETSVEDVNNYLRTLSLESSQIDFSASNEVVSSDFVGNRAACVVDSCSTIVHNKKQIHLYLFYDNENGYSCQVVRVVQKLAGITHPRFPK